MQHHRIPETEVLFAVADSVWEAEIVRLFGEGAAPLYRTLAEGRGEPGSLLSDAWVAREHAYAAWRAARGLEARVDGAEAA